MGEWEYLRIADETLGREVFVRAKSRSSLPEKIESCPTSLFAGRAAVVKGIISILLYYNTVNTCILCSSAKTGGGWIRGKLDQVLKGQHECNSIDIWTFFLGWRKGSKKKRFEDVFGYVFKFPGKFCH